MLADFAVLTRIGPNPRDGDFVQVDRDQQTLWRYSRVFKALNWAGLSRFGVGHSIKGWQNLRINP
jgi:hypothetical protein